MAEAMRALVMVVCLASMTLSWPVVSAAPPAHGQALRMTFDDLPPGALPEGWEVGATNLRGRLASCWVAHDGDGGKESRVMRITPQPGASGRTFNLCWTARVGFLDGEISVRVRAEGGRQDQGGGPIWRVQDGDNYYIARYNPLERNFRVYRVKGGIRRMLAGVSGLGIERGQWATIRIVQTGDHIEGWFDGRQVIDLRDTTFASPGGVGLWTKADADTSFDDFIVTPRGE